MPHDSMSVNFVRFVHTFPLPPVSYTHLDVYKRQTLASAIQNAINIPNKIICFFISAKFVVLLSL